MNINAWFSVGFHQAIGIIFPIVNFILLLVLTWKLMRRARTNGTKAH